MEGCIFSMPGRDEKINMDTFCMAEAIAYSASFQECFLLSILLEKVGSLLYTRKTYLLKDPSTLKVAPCKISNFRKTDLFTSTPYSHHLGPSKRSHLILKLDLVPRHHKQH